MRNGVGAAAVEPFLPIHIDPRIVIAHVAQQLGVTKPSVSYATKQLRENGYITMDHANFIVLTDKGMEIADRIYTRHKVLTDFFKKLGVDEATAREDACKVEHDLSEETFHALRTHIEEMR